VRVLVLNGVNLDLLGRRDPAIYGSDTLVDLERSIEAWAGELGCEVRCEQTNHEGAYVELLHGALGAVDGLILNPGAWTHYSWAIRDAVEPFAVPVVEVHLSDVDAREEWRRHSVLAGVATERIKGKGIAGYREALELIVASGGP
jgi:3-dehydroquinate dehydratase II